MNNFTKWVSFYGNAMSITENKPEGYSKNITLRYPLFCPFDGDSIRLTFDNYCGLEPITLSKVTILYNDDFYPITFGGCEACTIDARDNVVSDELPIDIVSGNKVIVSIYLGECTQMRSSVYAQGPLTGGQYAMGDQTLAKEFDINISRKTNIYYFLANASIRTKEDNHAIICYGDSITAQDWPDYLLLKYRESGVNNVSVIRRATSGSRILREYSCITYESYGLKGDKRFDHEIPMTDGADTIIIQQGINDIIHPVGTEVNPFRPMSDLPTCDELTTGLRTYIDKALGYGLKTYVGTLLPINGWRTYAPFREELKNAYNEYIRNLDDNIGVIDFDMAVRSEDDASSFASINDSGDHLHPSSKGYERMGEEAFMNV